MSGADHLDFDLLVRAIDGELTPAERIRVDAHLSACDGCRARYRELGALSVRIEQLVRVPASSAAFAAKRTQLDAIMASRAVASKVRTTGASLRWAMAIAATVILGLAVLPIARHLTPVSQAPTHSDTSASATFEIDGETFVPLPYSNPDLPISAPRVVEMQVPVSSLAEAGVIFEPVSAQAANPNSSVLADVLMGDDGEPVGVHVIAGEQY